MIHDDVFRPCRSIRWAALLFAMFFTPARGQDVEPVPMGEGQVVYKVPAPPQEDVVPRGVYQPLDAEVNNFIKLKSIKYDPNSARIVLSGKGLAVAVIDSGVNPNHLAFSGDKLLPGRNFSGVGAPDDTTDTYGHGSQVAAIVAGRDPRDLAPADRHDYRLTAGIAHEAKIIPLKVCDDNQLDPPTPARLNSALEWLLAHRDVFRQDHQVVLGVVVISLGGDNMKCPEEVNERRFDARYKAEMLKHRDLIRALRDAGVAVVMAAGNDYGLWNPEQGMAYPAVCPETISVGAVYDNEYDYRHDPRYPEHQMVFPGDVVAYYGPQGRCMPFSQRLSEIKGGPCRTDVFAPGIEVESAGKFDAFDPQKSRIGVTKKDGTSVAAPVTAGVVLLLQDAFLRKNPIGKLPPVDLIEQSLRSRTFDDKEEVPPCSNDNVKGTGETFYVLNAPEAYRRFNELFTGWPAARSYLNPEETVSETYQGIEQMIAPEDE